MSQPQPVRGKAYEVVFPIFDADGDLVTGAANRDSQVSKDGNAFAPCENEAEEIGTSGMYSLQLTPTEMTADIVAVIVKTSTTGAKTTPIVLYPWGSAPSAAGVGGARRSIRISDDLGNPVIGAKVWVTSDSAGSDVIAGTSVTDDNGSVSFMLDAGTTVYVWCDSSRANFRNPFSWTVV